MLLVSCVPMGHDTGVGVGVGLGLGVGLGAGVGAGAGGVSLPPQAAILMQMAVRNGQ